MKELKTFTTGKGTYDSFPDKTARAELPKKLTRPATAQVGDYLRIKAIGADGTMEVEAVPAPTGGATVPTKVSAFENDAGYTTEARVQELLAAFPTFKIEVVHELPAVGVEKTIYLVPFADDSGSYLEYLYVNGAWEVIGSEKNSGENVAQVEPAYSDRPLVFFGAPLQQTKTEIVCKFWYYSKTLQFTCYAKIKAQGNSTMKWPKKNQSVKLYKDEACTEKFKINFKGWGKQYKFVIKANWRDLTHVRDVGSVRLEAECAKNRENYAEMPELLRTSPNMGAVDGFPVLVYANGIYQGRYMWNIPKDAWMANMDDELETHCILCSEDYGSGCFRAAAKIDGSDWTDELHDTVPESIKTRWNQVIDFVMNSSDEDFAANLDSYIDVESLIDRHLMGLYSCDFDGYAKNQLYITYDGQKWYAVPYDKDGTWGNYWTGNAMLPYDYPRESYEDFTSTQSDGRGNLLFIRLERLFWARFQERWAILRDTVLSVANTTARMRELSDITPPYIVAEDYASTTANGAFTSIPNKNTCTIQQIQQFAAERHEWTDAYVAGLAPEVPVPCEGITLDKSSLNFTGEGTQTVTATVLPDGCTDSVVWVCSNPEIAAISVSGYVCTVEAIANGNATITATCGEYSASCSVAVSGIAEPVPCTGITLDKTEISFTEEGSQTIVATVTPADTTDKIVWSSDAPGVATVENGVVTPVGDGSSTITATCGNYSASCVVSVALPVNPVLYRATNIDVRSEYVDTGVKLFEDDIDFTVVYEGYILNASGGDHYLFQGGSFKCWYRLGLRLRTMFPGQSAFVEVMQTASSAIGSAIKVVITHIAGSNSYDIYLGHRAEDGTITQSTKQASVEYVQENGTLALAPSPAYIPTVNEFGIYSYAFSDDEITEVMNTYSDFPSYTVQTIDGITWSDTATYSINNGDITETGTNYITPDATEVPDGATLVRLYNVNDSTFTWQGVAQYDADMTFIMYTEGTAKTTRITAGLAANTKYVRFSAFPNDVATNVPATGLAAEFWTLTE